MISPASKTTTTPTRPYQRKAWKEQREKIIKDRCEWCGDIEGLSIHHMGTRKGDFFKLWHRAAKRLFLSHVGQEAQELDKAAFKAFKKSHKAEIQAEYETAKEKRLQDYMQMYNTVTICKRCHFNLHHGKVLCRFCGEGYHKRAYSCCWACLPVQEPERWARIRGKGRRGKPGNPGRTCRLRGWGRKCFSFIPIALFLGGA